MLKDDGAFGCALEFDISNTSWRGVLIAKK